MIGITFKIKNEYNNFIAQILKDVDVEKYEWDIYPGEIFQRHYNNKFFSEEHISGEYFSECINRREYYLIFADFKAFPIGKEHIEIQTFAQYIKSKCDIVFLCVDSQFIEVFSKNESILQKVYENCKAMGAKNIEIVNSIEDPDRYMYAF